MMKRTICFLLALMCVLATVVCALYQKAADKRALTDIERTADSNSFYVTDLENDNQAFFDLLTDLVAKHQATVVRTEYIGDKAGTIIYKMGVFADDYLENFNPPLLRGQPLRTPNQLVATFDTGDNAQVGMLRDWFADDRLVITSLTYVRTQRTLSPNGTYQVIGPPQQRQALLRDVAQALNRTPEELTKVSSGMFQSEGTAYLLIVVLLSIVAAVFTLTMMFYPVSRIQEIGTYKLLGVRNRDIWWQINRDILLSGVIVSLICLATPVIWVANSDANYYLILATVLGTVLVLGILLSTSMFAVIRNMRIAQLLKKAFDFRWSLRFSYILKFVMFVGLIFVVPFMAREVTTLVNDLAIQQAYEDTAQYITLSGIRLTAEELHASLNGDTTVEEKVRQLFLELNDTAQAQYIRTAKIVPNSGSHPVDEVVQQYFSVGESLAVLTVNQHYFERLPLAFPVSEHQAFDSESMTILVPDNLAEQREKLWAAIGPYVSLLHGHHRQTVDWRQLPLNFVAYEPSEQRVFSENIDFAGEDGGFVTNPIVICLPSEQVQAKVSGLTNSALSNPIRILDTPENRTAIEQAINNNQLAHNQLRFENVLASGFAAELAIAQSSSFVWVVIASLMIGVSVLSSYYVVLIIFASKRRQLLVSRLMGDTRIERYRNELISFALIYVFALCELLLLSRSWLAAVIYLGVVAIDLLVVWHLVQRHERQSFSLALKGEE